MEQTTSIRINSKPNVTVLTNIRAGIREGSSTSGAPAIEKTEFPYPKGTALFYGVNIKSGTCRQAIDCHDSVYTNHHNHKTQNPHTKQKKNKLCHLCFVFLFMLFQNSQKHASDDVLRHFALAGGIIALFPFAATISMFVGGSGFVSFLDLGHGRWCYWSRH